MRRIIGMVALVAAMLGGVAGMSSAASAPQLRGCSEPGTVRPMWFNPICNDGSYTVIGLHWSRWSGTADGRGEFHTHTRDYPIHVMAWRVRGGGYTRFRYQFSCHVPPGFPRTWTI